uniref:protein-tyrosine-phosphatase n=1 Tax=Rousettus aegyptiacus TaxID=9407 RepID=A0A7J8B9M4_ROUAE|nr:hypothetical protein HJG63_016178 [Rousettus aegyptiacus]
MRPPVLCAALLWLRGFLAQEDCGAGHPDGASGGPPLTVNVSGQGEPGSLSLDWTAPGPGWSGLVRLTPLGPLGSPEGPQLQALTNASSVEFQGLEPGSAHRLEVTALRPCGQNATVVLTAHAAPAPVRDLRLRSAGHPSGLQASWGAGPGQQGGHRLLLYHSESQTLACNTSVPPDARSHNFSGLLAGSKYVLEVATWAGHLQAKTSVHQWTEPRPPGQLVLRALGPSALQASWNGSEGAAWLRLVLRDLLGGANRTAAVRRGVSSHTFHHLSPGTPYELTLSAAAGPQRAAGPKAAEWTLPAPPLDLSLSPVGQSPALRASWTPPPGGRDGFRLQLYRLRPLTLDSMGTLASEARNFSWASLPPGAEFRLLLVTLRGPDQSRSANASAWTPPIAPPLVNVTSEGPTWLRASWVHAPGGRDGYQVALYRAGAPAGASAVGAEVDSASFSALTPGTEYEVVVASQAGPLHAAAAPASGWTYPLVPSELLASMQAGSAVISLVWADSPLGWAACCAQLSGAGHLSWEQPLVLGQAQLVLRGLPPGRNLSLTVLCRAGPLRASTHPVVLPVEPGLVQDVQCQPEATRLGLTWTVPPGDVGTCVVAAEQLAPGGSGQRVFQASTAGGALLLPGLLPATPYRLSLRVLGSNGLWSRTVTLVCATSADAWHPSELAAAPRLEPGPRMGVVLTRGLFGEDDGQIGWYGVIASTDMSLARPPRDAVNRTWHDHHYGGHDSYLATLLPSPFHPGPWATPEAWAVPVGTEDCGQAREICNGRLKPGSQYRFSVVAFTRLGAPETTLSFSAFSEPRTYVSPGAVPLPVAVGAVAGCVLAACAVLGLLRWRRARGQRRTEKNRFSPERTVHSLRRTHRPIPSHSFRQSFEAKSAHAQQAFFQEFEELKEVGKEQPRLEAEHPANASKNRYPHVLPYDHSRVRLAQLQGDPHSDYVNANFVPGYAHPQEFIATQGPLKKTLGDFWRLVWEQQVRVIVMLTVGMENGRVLCEHYWPADATPVTYGHITVHLLAEEPEDEWTQREFQLQHTAQPQLRRVKQLQFTTWADHSVPEGPGSLLAFTDLVREQARATQGPGPMLVHCSAGVGRTGTFVALVRLLQQLEEEQAVDVFNAVCALRLQRPLMIQTPSQYVFLHSCLLSRILEGPPASPRVEGTGSGSWRTLSAPSPVRRGPRPQPVAVADFAQACAERAANANAGFLEEYQLLLQAIPAAGSVPPPPGCKQDSTASYDRSTAWLSLEDEGSPPDEMPEAWLFPGGPSGHDHVVLMGPARPQELWQLVCEHQAQVLVSLCPPDSQDEGAAQLGTFLAIDQLLQQAGAERTVDIFNVALQQSQACGLMTPTLEQYIHLYQCLNSVLADGLP